MTSRDAFVKMPKGTTAFISHDSSQTDFEAADGAPVVIGCGADNCQHCSRLQREVPAKGGQFRFSRASGTLETFGPGNTLVISRPERVVSQIVAESTGIKVTDLEQCEGCRAIDFTLLLTERTAKYSLETGFDDLKTSSRLCQVCALLISSLVNPHSFNPDKTRPITLKAKVLGQEIELSFPSIEVGHEDLSCERISALFVYIKPTDLDTDSPLSGRLVERADNPHMARKWLTECQTNHPKCNRISASTGPVALPRRLINVGSPDGSQDPYLEEGAHRQGDYLVLSYRWGDPSTITRTTTNVLANFKERIPFGSLSQIFRDTILVTRSLALKYLWIDSLCIVQDSPEDKAAEIPRMAEIYAGALLALSASTSTSGESTLFTPRNFDSFVEIPKLSIGATTASAQSLFLTNRVLSDFSFDVIRGNLGSRGWCFQERLLPVRILHFGRDQLHWECHEGIWSESSTERMFYDDFTAGDDGGLRAAFQADKLVRDAARQGVTLGENATEEMNERWESFAAEASKPEEPSENKDSRRLYDTWYQAVSIYTSRQLTDKADRLPALAGAARRFNELANDNYAAGLWAGDIPQGLLWSRRAFQNVAVDPVIARRPGVGGWGETNGGPSKGRRGAPSWSWASVDGAVHWVKERHGPVHIGPVAVMTRPDGNEGYAGLDWAAIRVRGSLLELGQLSGIRPEANNPETQSDFEKELAMLPVPRRVQLDADDTAWEAALAAAGGTRPMYALLVCSIPVLPGEDVASSYLGYALMLRYWPAESAFRRVGIAKVAIRDFLQAPMVDIHIF